MITQEIMVPSHWPHRDGDINTSYIINYKIILRPNIWLAPDQPTSSSLLSQDSSSLQNETTRKVRHFPFPLCFIFLVQSHKFLCFLQSVRWRVLGRVMFRDVIQDVVMSVWEERRGLGSVQVTLRQRHPSADQARHAGTTYRSIYTLSPHYIN